ncbi:MAG: SDR family NAD(P)-dependent oxidoreductase [Candidatus Binataceae bacterium]
MHELDGKVAIITGGGYGIGKRITFAYAESGARIALAARTASALETTRAELEKLGARAIAITTDVSKEADCGRMAAQTLETFGRIDILVNNAGISGPTARATEMTLAAWQEVLDINLTGAWLAARAVLPVMERQGAGDIVNLSSFSGRRGVALRTPYVASKWAMVGMTQALAMEWGGRGIRVNCICPGAVAGDRIERVIRAASEARHTSPEQVRRGLTSMSAMGRMVTEEEVARTALFLVSGLASGLTGQTINVDAGAAMN